MKKFCCDSFRFRYEGDNEMGLNYRIIKLSPQFLNRSNFKDSPYRCLITEGYRILDDNVKKIFIEYCPNCGKELKKYYWSDEFVNEQKHNY